MNYLRNAWYMAGWVNELPEGGVLARRLLDVPVAIFRDAAGEPKAILDRCPHRFAPLSLGKVCDGALLCAYHGLAFDGDGACVSNPHGPIVAALRVDAYKVREQFKAFWIWFGEPELAEATPLPKFQFLCDAPELAFSCGYLHGEGNYQLYTDNLLDLTHVDFLHPNTLGGGAITRTKPEVRQEGNTVSISWHPRNEVPSPAQYHNLKFTSADQRVDSYTEVIWHPPSNIILNTGAVPVGTPMESAPVVNAVHVMTPETAETTHYFFASTRNFDVESEEANKRMAESRMRVFSTEDKPMIIAQSHRMEGSDFWALKPVLLPIDTGAARVRRVLGKLVAAEQSPKDQATAPERAYASVEEG